MALEQFHEEGPKGMAIMGGDGQYEVTVQPTPC